jgi:hypothetical protein
MRMKAIEGGSHPIVLAATSPATNRRAGRRHFGRLYMEFIWTVGPGEPISSRFLRPLPGPESMEKSMRELGVGAERFDPLSECDAVRLPGPKDRAGFEDNSQQQVLFEIGLVIVVPLLLATAIELIFRSLGG